VDGLAHTTTGAPKLLDLRDFSGEGRISLEQLHVVRGDTAIVAGQILTGMRRLNSLAGPPYFVGVLRERELGSSEAADVNGNGQLSDEFPMIAVRRRDGWAVVTDTDGDRSLDGEALVRDYAVARETFSYVSASNNNGPSPLSIAVNFGLDGADPVLDLCFDNSGHGTHVAGIAAGHDLFDVDGFNGVAPGAQLLGLKIADNSRGGITAGGSVVKAMNFAVTFADRHNLSLVINMSHGIGNEQEGGALIDSLINEFTFTNPNVLFVVSAGNQGPGISSVGFPGSAQQALSVCALSPSVFAHSPGPGVLDALNVVSSWSARGGEVAKPDLCAPGKAFSIVPPWLSGKEVLEGTSQAAPQVAGAAALLLSAVRARNGAVRAVDIARALKNTAVQPQGVTELDVGAGVPDLRAAFNWLMAGHQAGIYSVRALPAGDEQQHGSAAYRRSGFASAADTVQRFLVQSVGGQPAARLLLQTNVDWIRTPSVVEPRGGPVTIELTYVPSNLRNPGLYVGTVTARSATDTSAGALFELLNTVVVPHGLSPHGYRYKLGPGSTHRHFFDVPDDAGGLEVAVGLADPSSKATLYLFEPDGRPFRGRAERTVGGHRTSSVAIMAAADELVPGVYEAVVLAPQTDEVAYWLEVAVPDVAVESIQAGAVATLRNLGHNRVRAIVSAELLGATSNLSVEGSGSKQLKVSLPTSSWNRITGFGVTVSDSTGARVSDGPLIYSGARQIIDLASLEHYGDWNVELLPAFARGDVRTRWVAELEVVFLLPDALSLALADGSERAGVVLEPSAAQHVDFELTQVWHSTRHDLLPLVEVVARLPVGPPSIRRGVAMPTESER
jgi:subtilisin family serine protease